MGDLLICHVTFINYDKIGHLSVGQPLPNHIDRFLWANNNLDSRILFEKHSRSEFDHTIEVRLSRYCITLISELFRRRTLQSAQLRFTPVWFSTRWEETAPSLKLQDRTSTVAPAGTASPPSSTHPFLVSLRALLNCRFKVI